MRQKSGPAKAPAEAVLKDIRRATRRHFSAEDKIRIVLEGLRGEESIAELCRREGIAASMYYGWSKEFLEAGKKRLAGDTARAATLGRIVLAKLARIILRGHVLSEDSRKNVDEIRKMIEAHPAASAAGLAFFALSPLPSNHLFIAYGVTSLKIVFAAAPFFVGRFTSYLFWIASAGVAGRKLDLDAGDAVLGVGVYFVVPQLLIVPFMYLFVKIDWNALFEQGRLRIRTRNQ